MARSHRPLVPGARGHAARRGHDGIPENRPGLGNVWRQLLRDQEQKGHRAVFGRGRARPQHLRKGRQNDAAHWISLVRDQEHFLQRQEVRDQAG